MKSKPSPRLNPIIKYLLRRYKEQLLNRPYTEEATRIVDCLDYILEHSAEACNG